MFRLAAALAVTCVATNAALAATAPPPLHDFGPAPEFAGITGWLNSPPLTLAGLRGRVVLVDFWAYSCINCLRTLPFLTRWQHDYKDQGLTIVGVHAPEFQFERNARNVQAAIDRLHIDYPVAQDNDLAVWKAFNNEYWPAEYLIDRNGRIMYEHFGEGEYDTTENAIRTLLGDHPTAAPEPGSDLSKIGSPEMYFGLDRVEALASPEAPRDGTQTYSAPAALKLNQFALVGAWALSGEKALLAQAGGQIRLHCHAGKVFMVASSAQPVTMSVLVDGKPQPPVSVHESRLYTLFDSGDYGDHLVTVTIPHAGFEAFTFTFG